MTRFFRDGLSPTIADDVFPPGFVLRLHYSCY